MKKEKNEIKLITYDGLLKLQSKGLIFILVPKIGIKRIAEIMNRIIDDELLGVNKRPINFIKAPLWRGGYITADLWFFLTIF